MAILNILNELADSYIIPKENIAKFYGLIEDEDVEQLADAEAINTFCKEINMNADCCSSFKYTSDMVPITMKETDESAVYFVEYAQLKKYCESSKNDIISGLINICEQNHIYRDDIAVCFMNNEEELAESTRNLSLQSDDKNYKINNKIALTELYNDIISLKESDVMMFKSDALLEFGLDKQFKKDFKEDLMDTKVDDSKFSDFNKAKKLYKDYSKKIMNSDVDDKQKFRQLKFVLNQIKSDKKAISKHISKFKKDNNNFDDYLQQQKEEKANIKMEEMLNDFIQEYESLINELKGKNKPIRR